ncbi:MAG: [FeFe] hydrogenase H-cluster maturation GTPase HydF [Planctomycetota bacterium]|jgi:[FeFe] hydrogenase H-cluster maturation GTPase HydF|nr:[FeFe] hydrogenase H-cluster maturation GTPase HydF [Planctomycetota bacterium]
MDLNDTPSANRPHIGFFGRRNAGKSSLVNAVTGQDLAIVSEIAGTTTDPVYKSMELLPLGPVTIIDTPGVDDDAGELGRRRALRAGQALRRADAAVLVVDGAVGGTADDEELIRRFRAADIPFVVAWNKSDRPGPEPDPGALAVSALTGAGVEALKERLARLIVREEAKLRIVGDLIGPGDFVLLVVPIDLAAPRGRLILPQQQTIRDILEADAAAVVVKEHELRETLAGLGRKPSLVITDSQVFAKVAADTPRDVRLTSFSILFARRRGFLDEAVAGARTLDRLIDGDRVLVAEGCTHHRQCDDIGTVKLPRWIRHYTGRKIEFAFTAGRDFPDDLSGYRLIVHCGGCMLNGREMAHRRRQALDGGTPLTNYGVLIAHTQGILERCLEVFPRLRAGEGR